MIIYIRSFKNVAEDKVRSFLTGYNGMKLLEFALLSVCEALRNDPQKDLLIEETPSIQNYDFNLLNAGQPSSPYLYDNNYPQIAKEKVLALSAELYNKLVKCLTDVTISP